MMCSNPFVKDLRPDLRVLPHSKEARNRATPFGCGKCLHCRINRSREWTHRILLEQYVSNDSCFVTLTYDDDNLPEFGFLEKKDLQKYFKRLRRNVSPHNFRYFAVGEYGDDNGRPHYHICLFGLGYIDKELIKSKWDKGFVHVGHLNDYSARYITGYIMKGMYYDRLGEERPLIKEFMLSSKGKGGIGIDAIRKIAKQITENEYFEKRVIREFGTKNKKPIGRYLTKKLAELIGVKPEDISKDLYDYQMNVFEENINILDEYYNNIVNKNKDKRLSIEKKYKIYKQKRRL